MRIKSFLCRIANPEVDRIKIIYPRGKKSISFNLAKALRECQDY